MRLICKKYLWQDVSLGGSEVNFFSTSFKTLVDTIDLKYYLKEDSLSDFEYTFESINEVTNGLEIKMSNISFQCKNEILGLTSLQDFFEVYNENNKIKFSFEYYNDANVKLFSGIIYKDGVEFSERSNDILDIIAVTEEKEFIDYFSNQDLRMPLNPATWIRAQTLFGIPGSGNETTLLELRYIELGNLIRINFLTVQLQEYPANYYIAEKPFTFNPFSAGVTFAEMDNLFHVKSGYEQFRMDGIKMYEFFNSMFQEKGWIWYFRLGKLYIKERGAANLSTTVLNFNTDFLSHSVSSDLMDEAVDNVHVFSGSYYDNNSTNSALHVQRVGGGKYDLTGDIRHVVSNITTYTKTRPFVNLVYLSDSNRYLLNLFYLDYSRYTRDTERSIVRRRTTNGNNQYLFEPSEYPTIDFAQVRTLKINPITVSDNNTAGIDLNNPRANGGAYYGLGNFYKAAQTSTDSMIFYKGTPASSMVRYDSSTGYMFTHEIDCRRIEYQNNFKKFVRSANPILFDVEVKGLITEPFQNISISNYNYNNIVSTKTFSIQRLSFNVLNSTSKLTLQMI